MMFGIKLAVQWVAQHDELLALEVSSRHALSSVTGALNGSVHQLEHDPLTESMQSPFEAAALFSNEAL
jgi:hypothetical protein